MHVVVRIRVEFLLMIPRRDASSITPELCIQYNLSAGSDEDFINSADTIGVIRR
jgi:hypothetical protein